MGKLGAIRDGPITKAIRAAVALRQQLLADGMSESEADRICGQGLKGALGNSRAIPWRFYCEKCRDSGWMHIEPSPREMERLLRLYGDKPDYQEYIQKCEPCAWIQKQRNERRASGGGDEDDFESAARTRQKSR